MENSFYRFPAMAKLDEWTRSQQIEKIYNEYLEAEWDCSTAPDDFRGIDKMRSYGMELMDIIHATETALRMEFTDEEVAELRDAVEKKNRNRGYYRDGE